MNATMRQSRNFQVLDTETVAKCLARSCANLRFELADAHCKAVVLGGCQSGKTIFSLLLAGFPAPPVPASAPSCVFTRFQNSPGLKTPQLTVPLDLVFLLSRLDPSVMAGEDLTVTIEGGEEISRVVAKINSILFRAKPKLMSGDFLEIFISLEFPGVFSEKFTLVDTPSPDGQIFRGPAQIAAQIRRSLKNANLIFLVLDATAPEPPRGLFDLVEEAVKDESINCGDVTIFLNKMDSLPFGPSSIKINQFRQIFEISALRGFLNFLGRTKDEPALPGNFLKNKLRDFFPRLLSKAVAQAKLAVAEFLEELAVLQSPSFAFSDSEASELDAVFSQYTEDLRANLEISALRELPVPADAPTMIGLGSAAKIVEGLNSQPVLEFLRNFAQVAFRDWQANFLAAAAAAAEDAASLRPKWLRSSALFLRKCGAPGGVRKRAVKLFQKFEEPQIPASLVIPATQLNELIFGRAKLIPVVTRKTLFAAEGLKRFEISENCLSTFLVELCELFRAEALSKLADLFMQPALAEFEAFQKILKTPGSETVEVPLAEDFVEFCEAVARYPEVSGFRF